jgi:DNA replication and repair protein RecF
MLTYTSKGIHKDDLLFEMDHVNQENRFSGTAEIFLISLKLAQMSLVKELTKKTPILFLMIFLINLMTPGFLN